MNPLVRPAPVAVPASALRPAVVDEDAGHGQQQQQQQTQAALEQLAAAGVESFELGEAEAAADRHGGKRKRVVLSIHEKQQVLQRLELGEPPAAIARGFGISRQQVSDIKKNRARILAFCVDAKHLSTLQRKTLRATSEFHPGVEQELYRWLIRQRRLRRGVTPDALAAKTTELFMQYAAPGDSNGAGGHAQAPASSFKAIANWLRHFKRAHGITSLAEGDLEQLPERFSPAMDLAVVLSSSDGPSASAATAGVGGSAPTAGAPLPLNVDEVTSYISGMPGAGDPMASTTAAATTSGLAAVVDSIHRLDAQLSVFERHMAVKLDDLDTRVEKLCFAVLPPRFTT